MRSHSNSRPFLPPSWRLISKRRCLKSTSHTCCPGERRWPANTGRHGKQLVVRLLIVVLIVGLLFGMGEISRRLSLRRIQDPNRRRIMSMVHRLLTMFAIAVVALFSVASDLRSLATYFGLLTAGMAVALQNVILASLGYLVLMGKRGIRIGDRIQISGITGDVINMGMLQFQLREFDVEEERFTGHVATFSNSLVFMSPAIGLLKFSSAPGTAAKHRTTKEQRGMRRAIE